MLLALKVALRRCSMQWSNSSGGNNNRRFEPSVFVKNGKKDSLHLPLFRAESSVSNFCFCVYACCNGSKVSRFILRQRSTCNSRVITVAVKLAPEASRVVVHLQDGKWKMGLDPKFVVCDRTSKSLWVNFCEVVGGGFAFSELLLHDDVSQQRNVMSHPWNEPQRHANSKSDQNCLPCLAKSHSSPWQILLRKGWSSNSERVDNDVSYTASLFGSVAQIAREEGARSCVVHSRSKWQTKCCSINWWRLRVDAPLIT